MAEFYPDAVLHEPPSQRSGGPGRPRKRGRRLPKPGEDVAAKRPRPTVVGWYGDSTRKVGVVSDEGGYWRSGKGLVPVRWVHVEDRQGTHRPEYFFCTASSWSPEMIVSTYIQRWDIEVTFQEVKNHLGLRGLRVWAERSVRRAGPFSSGCIPLLCFSTYASEVRTTDAIFLRGLLVGRARHLSPSPTPVRGCATIFRLKEFLHTLIARIIANI